MDYKTQHHEAKLALWSMGDQATPHALMHLLYDWELKVQESTRQILKI